MSDNWDQSSDDGGSSFMGGDSLPACKFDALGVTHGGRVTKISEKNDTKPDGTVKTWANGDAMRVWVFELDGTRSLWVRGNMVTAIRDAVKAAGLSTPIGAYIEVQHHELGTPKPGQSPAKLFRARVLQPGQQPTVQAAPVAPPVAHVTQPLPVAAPAATPW